MRSICLPLLVTASLWVAAPALARPSDAEIGRRGERYTQLVLEGSFAGSADARTGDGGGGALRVGRAIPAAFLVVVPEAGADLYLFSGPQQATLYGAFAGARLRVAGPVEPGAFAHFGCAGVDSDRAYAAPSLDVGVTVDVTFHERLLVGLQAQYKTALSAGGNPHFDWYTIGLGVGVKL